MSKKYVNIYQLEIYKNQIKRLLEKEDSNTLNTLKEVSDYISSNTKKQSNCPNCGAVIVSEICEYCGTNLKLIGVI